MEQSSTAFKDSYKEKFFVEEIDLTEIPLEKYHTLTLNGLRYHTIDIKHTPKKELERIARECEVVEKSCWKAQENFFDYMKLRDIMTYVEDKGKIIAFQISSYWTMDQYFVFDLDETMVMKEYRGRGMARILSAVSIRLFFLRCWKMKGIKKMVFMGLTPNARLIHTLEKYHFIYKFLDNTFEPSQNLIKLHDTYLEKKGASLVHKDYPFFLKSIFPGSQKPDDYEMRLSEKVKQMMPPGLDFRYRGDAFLFFAAFGKINVLPALAGLMFLSFGIKALFNKKLGLLGLKKNEDAKRYIERKEKASIERRKGERRKATPIQEKAPEIQGITEGITERRVNKRRMEDR